MERPTSIPDDEHTRPTVTYEDAAAPADDAVRPDEILDEILDGVDEASRESFPASDPPSWIPESLSRNIS